MPCYRLEDGGILLSVRLTPRGGRDAIDGIATLAGGRSVLLARVRAAPEKGAANDALVALIAEAFGRPKSAIGVTAGFTARIKQVRISGDPMSLAHRADRWRESS